MKLCVLLCLLWLALPLAAQPQPRSGGKNRMSSTEFALRKIGQVAVQVKDLNRAATFYSDTLGLKLLLKQSNLAVLDCGGFTLLLTLPEKETERLQNSVLYFDVPDIQQAAQTLTKRGVAFAEPPNQVGKLGSTDVWIAIFRDSEGNLMGLRSLKPAKQA